MKISFEGEYLSKVLSDIKDFVEWASKKDPDQAVEAEVLMDVVSYIEVDSNSNSEGYYIVTVVETLAVACTCKGFHFRKECAHIEGYNGSRA